MKRLILLGLLTATSTTLYASDVQSDVEGLISDLPPSEIIANVDAELQRPDSDHTSLLHTLTTLRNMKGTDAEFTRCQREFDRVRERVLEKLGEPPAYVASAPPSLVRPATDPILEIINRVAAALQRPPIEHPVLMKSLVDLYIDKGEDPEFARRKTAFDEVKRKVLAKVNKRYVFDFLEMNKVLSYSRSMKALKFMISENPEFEELRGLITAVEGVMATGGQIPGPEAKLRVIEEALGRYSAIPEFLYFRDMLLQLKDENERMVLNNASAPPRAALVPPAPAPIATPPEFAAALAAVDTALREAEGQDAANRLQVATAQNMALQAMQAEHGVNAYFSGNAEAYERLMRSVNAMEDAANAEIEVATRHADDAAARRERAARAAMARINNSSQS